MFQQVHLSTPEMSMIRSKKLQGKFLDRMDVGDKPKDQVDNLPLKRKSVQNHAGYR